MRLAAASSAGEVAISLRARNSTISMLSTVKACELIPRSALYYRWPNDRLLRESRSIGSRSNVKTLWWSFGPYDGQITDPHLLALIKKRFGPDYVHSASALGTFGQCAYRFFAQRVLKLEPRGEAALDLRYWMPASFCTTFCVVSSTAPR